VKGRTKLSPSPLSRNEAERFKSRPIAAQDQQPVLPAAPNTHKDPAAITCGESGGRSHQS
jgi:hypothetical protein